MIDDMLRQNWSTLHSPSIDLSYAFAKAPRPLVKGQAWEVWIALQFQGRVTAAAVSFETCF